MLFRHVLATVAVLVAAPTFADSPNLALKPTDEGVFAFDTGQIQGTIRLDEAYHGVTRLVDKRTGTQVIDPRYSALNLFKLMSVNQIMGQPRNMERTTRGSSHWVEAKWFATDGHKGEVTARYEVAEANAIDVTVTVRSQGAYRGYELFMSNYFDKAFALGIPLQISTKRHTDRPNVAQGGRAMGDLDRGMRSAPRANAVEPVFEVSRRPMRLGRGRNILSDHRTQRLRLCFQTAFSPDEHLWAAPFYGGAIDECAWHTAETKA